MDLSNYLLVLCWTVFEEVLMTCLTQHFTEYLTRVSIPEFGVILFGSMLTFCLALDRIIGDVSLLIILDEYHLVAI